MGRPLRAVALPARRGAPAVLILALTACATMPGTAERRGEGEQDSRVITAAEIAKSSARTAWDALRLVARINLRETAHGAPAGMTMRGRSSFHLDDSPAVVVDGVIVHDFRFLRTVDARSIASIEILNGIDGTLRYGTGSGGGVVVVTTRSP